MRRLMVAIAAAIAAALILGVAFAGAESPTVTIEDASNVLYTSAKAKGTVDPKGKETYCHFEYVSQAQLEENLTNGGGEFDNSGFAECSGNPHNGTGAQDVEGTLSGLTPSTVYHLRLVAGNEDGQSAAVAANTFETDAVGKPTVTIDPVTTFTGTTAHFSGQINPNAPNSDPSFHVNWHFECNPGCPGAEGPALGTANSPQAVAADAKGLEPNTDYEVKLVAESPGGSESAGPVSFKTTAVGPDALTIPAFVLEGGTSALIGGRVNAHNSATTWWVEYGTTSGYGQSLPATKDASAGSGGQLQFQTEELTGLSLNTTYHFRVTAKNAQGEVHGDDLTFKTPVPAEPPASCPNAAFRTGPSANLPDCRAYEDVTPLNLLGARASVSAVAEDGGAAFWQTTANLSGFEENGVWNTFLAKRTASGWTSQTAVQLPGRMTTVFYGSGSQGPPSFYTPNLDGPVIWQIFDAVNPEDPDPITGPSRNYEDLYRRENDGSFAWLTQGSDMAPAGSEGVNFLGASPDGMTVYFSSREGRRYEPDAPEGGIYIRHGQTTSVMKDENGDTIPNFVHFPNGEKVFTSPVGILSTDGSSLALKQYSTGENPDGSNTVKSDLYFYEAELGYARKVLSTYRDVGLTGISADGSKVFFSTDAKITPDDVDSQNDLYEYNADTDSFSRVTGTVDGPGPGNGETSPDIAKITPDGTVYFNSTEQLDGGKGVKGVPNLYRAEEGAIHYVTTFNQPLANVLGQPPSLQLSNDGKALLIRTADRITSYNNAGHYEVYAYHSTDGTIVCVSCRRDGSVPAGNSALSDWYNMHNSDRHAEHVFFSTTDELVPSDDNGQSDVYEYDATTGTTSLISTGESPAASTLSGVGGDGRDVFFTSLDSLLPHDQNVGTFKVFDARIDGGFAEPVAPAVCEGEGCRGAGPAKPADVAPATQSFSGPGNPKPKAKKHRKAKKHKHKSQKKHQSKSHKRNANRNGRTGR